jgi:hypothetical protein
VDVGAVECARYVLQPWYPGAVYQRIYYLAEEEGATKNCHCPIGKRLGMVHSGSPDSSGKHELTGWIRVGIRINSAYDRVGFVIFRQKVSKTVAIPDYIPFVYGACA